MANKALTAATTKSGATAIHAHDDTNHLVDISNLRVILHEEDGYWFAQGVEIDYSAEAHTMEDVKRRFQEGLCATVQLHLARFGDIRNLLKWAPVSEWRGLGGDKWRYSQVSLHSVQKTLCFPEEFPYAGINFYERALEPVAA